MEWCHCILLVLSWLWLGKCEIKLENNGYSGIIVAIKHRIPEDKELIESIKRLFDEGSKLLHTATKGRAYFKDVTIAIPSTWSDKPFYQEIFVDYFSRSHVRIDIENPSYEDLPYTLQFGKCGSQGEYIHFTPNFLQRKFYVPEGKYERYLVHEWIHFRYGVFDEYGSTSDKRFPNLYVHKSKIYPTTCVEEMDGWLISNTPGACELERSTSKFSNCFFRHNTEIQTNNASIMYYPDVIPLNRLCEDSKPLKHNTEAPTPQNMFCKEKSTWDVVEKHQDFYRNQNAIPVTSIPATTFRLVRKRNERGRAVLVLDLSESMLLNNRIQWLRLSATRFVKYEVADDIYLGIVLFNNGSRTLFNLTKVTTISRKSFERGLANLPLVPATSIGAGLRTGIAVLKNNTRNSIEGGVITLMTDGEENTRPWIRDVQHELKRERVIVNVIAFGRDADTEIEDLANESGGTAYFINDVSFISATNGLDVAFFESLTSQSDVDFEPVLVIRDKRINIRPKSSTEIGVHIDDDIGKDTKFNIWSSDISNIDAIVTNPNSRAYGKNSGEYTKDAGLANVIIFEFRKAQVGNWTVKLMNSDSLNSREISLTVTSQTMNVQDQPVRIRTRQTGHEVINRKLVISALAEVKKDFNAVIGAKVTAKLEIPDGTSVTTVMKDDGYGIDMIANDGLYSGQFHIPIQDGRYVIKSTMANDGKAKLKKGSLSISSSGSIMNRGMNQSEADKLGLGKPRSSFEVSEFLLINDTSSTDDDDDKLPTTTEDLSFTHREGNAVEIKIPSSVFNPNLLNTNSNLLYDYSAFLVSTVERLITFKWTLPMKAKKIEARGHTNRDTLKGVLHSYPNATKFDLKPVRKGPSSITFPEGRQKFTLELPKSYYPKTNDRMNTVYFRLVAKSEHGNVTIVSNTLASTLGLGEYHAYLIKLKSSTPQPILTTQSKSASPQPNPYPQQPTNLNPRAIPTTTRKSLGSGIIAVIVVVGVVIIAAIPAVVYVCRKRGAN